MSVCHAPGVILFLYYYEAFYKVHKSCQVLQYFQHVYVHVILAHSPKENPLSELQISRYSLFTIVWISLQNILLSFQFDSSFLDHCASLSVTQQLISPQKKNNKLLCLPRFTLLFDLIKEKVTPFIFVVPLFFPLFSQNTNIVHVQLCVCVCNNIEEVNLQSETMCAGK